MPRLTVFAAFRLPLTDAATPSLPSRGAEEPSLFVGRSGCLVASERQATAAREPVTLLARDTQPFEHSTRNPARTTESPECGNRFEILQDREMSLKPDRVVTVSAAPSLDGKPVFAVRQRPSLVIRGGPAVNPVRRLSASLSRLERSSRISGQRWI